MKLEMTPSGVHVFLKGVHYEDAITAIESVISKPAKTRFSIMEDIDWTLSICSDYDLNTYATMSANCDVVEGYRERGFHVKSNKNPSFHIDVSYKGVIKEHSMLWDTPEQLLEYLYCLRRYYKIFSR